MKKILIVILLTLLLTSCWEWYSEWSRAGKIIKFSEKGFFNKSWEGEMLLWSMTTNSNGILVPEKFRFSIPEGMKDDDLIKGINDCMLNWVNCKLDYNQDALINPFYVETGYYITWVSSNALK